MIINGMDFPNQIFDAIQEGKLVVFAGAGVSMGAPTRLPDFIKLTKKIAEETGRVFKKNDVCDVFLGSLKADRIDVNGAAAKILSTTCLQHNPLHEAIIDLYMTSDQIKIVTTNYDLMFEQVLDERNASIPISVSPSLPLGSDFSGLIHIHGNVNNPKYMVVTDEDFGKAYLTEGYCSRFLVHLFESYTVLFIGYSYNDIIMRYLTKAMSRQHSAPKYILTDNSQVNWEAMGISPLYYPKSNHDVMRKALVMLGAYAKRGLWDWKNRFVAIADAPPKDPSLVEEIEYCLNKVEHSKIMASCIRGPKWLELLDGKGIFSHCFQKGQDINDGDKIWANWLCDNFIGNEDDCLLLLFAKHGNQFSNSFVEILLGKITAIINNLNDNCFKMYMILLDQFIIDPLYIRFFIETAHKRHMHHLCLHLFMKLFTPLISLEQNSWMQDGLDSKHKFIGNYFVTNHVWKLIHKEVVLLFAYEITSFVCKIIEELHYKYEEIGQASKEKEPWSIVFLTIEDRPEENVNDPLHVLINAFFESIKVIPEKNDTRFFLRKCLKSDSILLRKVALRGIRETECYSHNEKIDIILNNDLVWFTEGKEQVFLLAQNSFSKASTIKQNQLLDSIENGPDKYIDERNKQYAIYNWCVWLLRTNPTNQRIISLFNQKQEEYGFEPRDYPERNIVFGNATFIEEKNPFSDQVLLNMPFDELAERLLHYDKDSFTGPTRWDLLDSFTDCVRNDIPRALKFTRYLYAEKVSDIDIWNSLLHGFEDAELTKNDTISICHEFVNIIGILPKTEELASFLLKIVQKEETRQQFVEYEEVLLELSLHIWECRSRIIPDYLSTNELTDKVLYTTTGIILWCWIKMVSYSGQSGFCDPYRAKLEEALQFDSWEQEITVCVLSGHLNLLYRKDPEWCKIHLIPLFISNNKDLFSSAWTGFLHFSNGINKETLDIMLKMHLSAVKNISWLEDETRKRFLDSYLSLLIYVIDKPTRKYIPALYRSCSIDDKVDFIEAICQRLRNTTLKYKEKWWNNWLKHFIEIRKDNKPVELSDPECSALFMLLPNLDFVFDDAVNILCRGKLPSSLDPLFWYELHENISLTNHSQSMVKLLISVLRSLKVPGSEREYVRIIAGGLCDLSDTEKEKLYEACLKCNIDIIIN